MLDLARFLEWTGRITWCLGRTRTPAKGQKRPSRVWQWEELEERTVPTLLGQQLFPADYPWNQNIANAPVVTNSAAIIAHIGASIGIHPDWGNDSASNGNSPLYGIPYNVVHGNSTAKISVVIDNYPGESDVISVPIPANAVIEGDFQNGPNPNGGGYGANQRGDSHLIVWDEDNNIAYELYGVTRPTDPKLFPNDNDVEATHTDGLWHAAQETVWNMNTDSFRTLGATSADAAGLSILAGLARPDEGLPVSQGGQGAIDHALRLTLPSGDVDPQYIYPASHQVNVSSSSTNLPFGARLRLVDTPAVDAAIAAMGPEAQIIAHAMQQYGLVLADIGSAMYVTGSSSAQDAGNNINATWDMNDVLGLHALTASDFEVVNLAPIVTGLSANGGAGTSITITGQNFSGSAGHLTVLFGSTPANSVTYVSDTQLTAVVPNGTGTVSVRVQSGVTATDNISDNPNANAAAPIFGYGTSPSLGAPQFTFGAAQIISGANSTVSFASPSVVAGMTDLVTFVVKDTTGSAVVGLNNSAFALSLAGGASAGTFSTVTATATPGTYTATFTAVAAGSSSTLSVTVSSVAVSTHPTITVTPAPTFGIIAPVGAIAAAAGYDRPTFSWTASPGADHYYLIVYDNNTGAAPIVVPSILGTTYIPTLAQALTPGHGYTTYLYAFKGQAYTLVTKTFSLAALAAPTAVTPSGMVAAANGYDRPTFSWMPSPGADHYYLVVYDNSIATTMIVAIVNGVSYAASATQVMTPGHSFTTSLYAVSTNSQAYTLATRTFTLAALAVPTGLNPAGVVAAATGYDRPTFSWSASPGADHYYMLVYDSTTGATPIVAIVTSTSYAATAAQALTPGHSYVAGVYAVSTNSKASTLGTQAFTLAALPTPTGLTPSGTVAAGSGFDRPTFRWTATPGADHYYLVVRDNTTGAAPIVATVTGVSYVTPAAQALTPGHGFTTSLYAVSTNNQAYTLAAKTFALASLAAPTLMTPIGALAMSPASFTWSAVAGADHYYLYVVDDSTGQVFINTVSPTTASFSPSTPLTRGHRYTWLVAAVADTHVGIWSASQDFTIS